MYSLDPGNLVALLRESPFHIDSLLQLSEVSKHNGDNSLAGEFIGKDRIQQDENDVLATCGQNCFERLPFLVHDDFSMDIEQALFAFEKSFHSLFNIASGSVRLSFMEVENRSFFLAIHRHIQ